jgi:5-methyltetrahydropteroyltriglutamate--homocysteine methyltransferase
MERSDDRILTTHAGSLPRPGSLLPLIKARESGERYDAEEYAATTRDAVMNSVRKQVDVGLDIVDDGEMGKPGFIPYVNERLGGFEYSDEKRGSPFGGSREFRDFPEFYEWFNKTMPSLSISSRHMVCTAPVTYKGQAAVQADIERLHSALDGRTYTEAFLPAISPTSVEDWQVNKYYKSQDEFLFAIADAMHEEYKAIVDAGLLLQIDDPHIATYYALHPEMDVKAFRKWAARHIEALNHALRGLPRERVRWHTCYGINIGPRVNDVQLKDIIDLVLKIRAGAFSFEAANPRHEHEWREWEKVKMPSGAILIPGVITQSSVLVEHPQLVADRIARFASVVGRENVIAGADCGFGTFAGSNEIHESVAWAKLNALVEGARLASKALWSKPAKKKAKAKARPAAKKAKARKATTKKSGKKRKS